MLILAVFMPFNMKESASITLVSVLRHPLIFSGRATSVHTQYDNLSVWHHYRKHVDRN
jgi:hypothetical protein